MLVELSCGSLEDNPVDIHKLGGYPPPFPRAPIPHLLPQGVPHPHPP